MSEKPTRSSVYDVYLYRHGGDTGSHVPIDIQLKPFLDCMCRSFHFSRLCRMVRVVRVRDGLLVWEGRL